VDRIFEAFSNSLYNIKYINVEKYKEINRESIKLCKKLYGNFFLFSLFQHFFLEHLAHMRR
jgi:hypothetical protein